MNHILICCNIHDIIVITMLRKFVQKLNYNRSNSITKIKFKISPEAKRLAKKLFENKSEKYRQNIGDELLDELANMAKKEMDEYHPNNMVITNPVANTSTYTIELLSEVKY